MKKNSYICLLFLLLWGILSAETLDDLVKNGHLRIKTWVKPSEKIIAKQQLDLNIQIQTDKWFKGGTRIAIPNVTNAIILQRNQFAVNSTNREGGTTWATQLWILTLYPQKSGQYTVPPIELTIKVAGEKSSDVKGKIKTNSVTFTAKTPPTLIDIPQWVATTRFEIKENYSHKEDEKLKPGDAIERTITFTGDNLVAMMLPKMPRSAIKGVAVYHKPPRVEDKSNRGSYTGKRIESRTYVFEQPGTYQFPELKFYWWDLENSVQKEITLPAKEFIVTGQIVATPPPI